MCPEVFIVLFLLSRRESETMGNEEPNRKGKEKNKKKKEVKCTLWNLLFVPQTSLLGTPAINIVVGRRVVARIS